MDKTGKKPTNTIHDSLMDFSDPLVITVRADNENFEVLVNRSATVGQVLLLLFNAYERTYEQAEKTLDKLGKEGYTNSSVIH